MRHTQIYIKDVYEKVIYQSEKIERNLNINSRVVKHKRGHLFSGLFFLVILNYMEKCIRFSKAVCSVCIYLNYNIT